ncbi:hypothetical protein Pen01_78300 [Phytomonospora endophytica]|nr:hypothetical protein Pen01_78300 [Phytomonospora endophytica]
MWIGPVSVVEGETCQTAVPGAERVVGEQRGRGRATSSSRMPEQVGQEGNAAGELTGRGRCGGFDGEAVVGQDER